MEALTIRLEKKQEQRAVEELTRGAFWDVYVPGCTEHYVLHRLRESQEFIWELDFAAEYKGVLAGQIAYTEANVTDSRGNRHPVISFGPVSVKPEYKGQGIGSALISYSLGRAKELGYPAVCIYGDPRYYSRFGFVCGETYGILTEDGMYAPALQVLELQPGAMEKISGRFCESSAFAVDEEKFLEFEKSFPKRPKGFLESQRDFQILCSLRHNAEKTNTPLLETDRLILRPLCVGDAREIFEKWTSDPEVTRFMNYNRHESVEDTVQWLKMEEENREREDNYTWGFALKGSGELIGSGGIMCKEEGGIFELGYNICREYWNQGYTTEASKRILEFAVDELGITRFLGRHAKENPVSGRVMEKLGFVYQRDGSYTSNDRARTFESREYELEIPVPQSREMRRKDRRMPEDAALAVADQCEWAVISMIDEEGFPYGVPVSIAREGRFLYFHTAKEGQKLTCMKAQPWVSVTCVGDTKRALDKFTTEYESALIRGRASQVTDKEEKIHALRLICQRHTPSNMGKFDRAIKKSLDITGVWKIRIFTVTGKGNKVKE